MLLGSSWLISEVLLQAMCIPYCRYGGQEARHHNSLALAVVLAGGCPTQPQEGERLLFAQGAWWHRVGRRSPCWKLGNNGVFPNSPALRSFVQKRKAMHAYVNKTDSIRWCLFHLLSFLGTHPQACCPTASLKKVIGSTKPWAETELLKHFHLYQTMGNLTKAHALSHSIRSSLS